MKATLSCFIILFCFFGPVAKATEVRLEHLQAAFIFKFTNYIEWPSMEDKTFNIAVYNNDEMYEALRATFDGRVVNGKNAVVINLKKFDKGFRCNILYVHEALPISLEHLTQKGLLTISHGNKGPQNGILINFYVDHEDKLRFEINSESAVDHSLKINSRLLKVSRPQK